MKQVVIENPVINSVFKKPSRHFLFTEDGITDLWNAKNIIRKHLSQPIKEAVKP